MRGLLEYSGLATKIKAMKSKLLTTEDFISLAEQEDIAGIVSRLKQYESYRDALADVNENLVRRHQLEELVRTTLYTDYYKVYRFSHATQKAFLKAYFMKYEIEIIIRALRRCHGIDSEIPSEIYAAERPLYDKKCGINVREVATASTVGEVVSALKGSVYYDIMHTIYKKGGESFFEYESVLNIFYFSALWKACHKNLTGNDLDIIKENYGEEIDLLNIQWLYRAKKYNKLSPPQIYSLIIPIHYRIKKQDIIYLIKTESEDDFNRTINKLAYVKKIGDINTINIEKAYEERMKKLRHDGLKKFPYSIACVDSYFYQKEMEINMLVRITECVRYSVSRDKKVQYILGA